MNRPSPGLAALNAGEPSRSPEGTTMLAASSRKHIANAGRLGSGPALGPNLAISSATSGPKHHRQLRRNQWLRSVSTK